MSHKLLLLLGLLFAVTLSAFAQTTQWSGILDPSRATNWSNAGVQGGIKDGSWPICVTINPEGANGSPVAPTDVDNALANSSCHSSYPNGYVVSLKAGSYYFSSGIDFANHSHVVLRGAGADKTFLHFSGDTGCFGLYSLICIENDAESWTGGWAEDAKISGTLSKGVTTLTLTGADYGLVVGAPIVLDACSSGLTGNSTSTSADGCTTGTVKDNGNLFFCDTHAVCTGGSATGNYRTNRPQSEVHIVTSVSCTGSGPYTCTVGIDHGLELPNWAGAGSPEAWWADRTVTEDGIENLSVDSGNVTAGSSHHSIGMIWTTNCWITGVRSVRGLGAHVTIWTSAHDTVANNYFYGTASPGTVSYGVSPVQTGDLLIENNIFQHVTAPIANDGPDSGSVFAFDFATNDAYNNSSYLLASDEPHSAGDVMELFEGNEGLEFNADDIHGTEDMQTLFRDWYSGEATGLITKGPPVAVQIAGWQRYENIIGNVLGFSKTQSGTYQDNATAICGNQPTLGTSNPIYFIGCGGNSYSMYDSLAGSTLMRWGNYDVATGAARWCGNSSDPGWSTTCASTSEVPTALSIYANAVPTSTTLPDSFFLPNSGASAPSFWKTPWGTPPWPAIGPDVTGQVGPGGHAANIPAELCWANSSIDASYSNTYSITGASWSGGKATLKVSIPTGNYPSGWVTISGVTPSGYNGTFNFTGTFSIGNITSITYALPSNPGTYSSGGTATYPLVRTFNAGNCYGSSGSAPAPPTKLTDTVH